MLNHALARGKVTRAHLHRGGILLLGAEQFGAAYAMQVVRQGITRLAGELRPIAS